MIQTTIAFLVKDSKILLAMKKRGHGVGKWNGTGGKSLPKETIEQTAVREAEEEIGVTPLSLRKVGEITFTFPPEKNFNHQSTVFLCDSWKGDPTESEEMLPKWFSLDEVPYSDMWESDQYWLPKVLVGKLIIATVDSGSGDSLHSYKDEEVNSF